MIARNESSLLPGCLESIREGVDELVLVDTGSTDATVALARAAGAEVLTRAWDDDFSAPRNLAAAHATGDFILQLDADERLAPGSMAALRALLPGARFDVGLVRCHNADALDAPHAAVVEGSRRSGEPALLPRLIRRTPDLRWEGCIHESVLGWAAARGGRIQPVPLDLVHLGYVNQLVKERDKRARNLALLAKRVASRPDDVIAYGYLAQDLLAGGQVGEAAEAAERGWEALGRQAGAPSIRRLAVVRAAAAVRLDRPEVALESVARGIAQQGPNPDLAFHEGCALELLAERAAGAARAGLLARAEEAHRAALRLLVRGGFEQVLHASPAAAWARVGATAIRGGRAVEGREAFAAARAAGAGEALALVEARALLDAGRAADALAVLEPVLLRVPGGWALAARAADALGAHAEARSFEARARAAAL